MGILEVLTDLKLQATLPLDTDDDGSDDDNVLMVFDDHYSFDKQIKIYDDEGDKEVDVGPSIKEIYSLGDVRGLSREIQLRELHKRSSLYNHRHETAEKKRTCEQRRRRRINDKLKVLQRLIPHSEKTDCVSILADTAKYIKYLKLQIEMMTRSNVQGQLMLPYVPPTCMSIVTRHNMQLRGGNTFDGCTTVSPGVPAMRPILCPPLLLPPFATSFAPLFSPAIPQQSPAGFFTLGTQ